MKHNEITSSIQLAARLTDALYREGIVNSDSAQALFDVLADALDKRPDVVASVSEDLTTRQQDIDASFKEVLTRLDELEQDYLRQYAKQIAKDAAASVTGGSNSKVIDTNSDDSSLSCTTIGGSNED